MTSPDIAPLERALGRLEGKMDMVLARLDEHGAQVRREGEDREVLEKRLSKVEVAQSVTRRLSAFLAFSISTGAAVLGSVIGR